MERIVFFMRNDFTIEFSADITINTRTISFAQDPAQHGIDCENAVELNKDYSTSYNYNIYLIIVKCLVQ